jgi:hypothetical protein
MNEDTFVVLPDDWEDDKREYVPVGEGEFGVMVNAAVKKSDERVNVDFLILDDGPFARRHLFQTFVLSTTGGKNSFKEFLAVIGLARQDGGVELRACMHKLLRVVVKHNVQNGKVYANVEEYRKAGG